MSIREPFAAGRFFSADKTGLFNQVNALINKNNKKINAIGVMCPHSTFINSGIVTGNVLSMINIPNTIVIMCPNHTFNGHPFSIWKTGYWKTPLGDIPVDEDFCNIFMSKTNLLVEDELPHKQEHGIEVQLPFLKILNSDIKIVPITVRNDSVSNYNELGKALAYSIKESDKEVLIFTSSDMTHYETYESAKLKDKIALDSMEQLNVDDFQNKLTRNRISMCGDAAASVMMAASKQLGATHGKTIQYQTSAAVDGNYNSVVGYASLIISSDVL